MSKAHGRVEVDDRLFEARCLYDDAVEVAFQSCYAGQFGGGGEAVGVQFGQFGGQVAVERHTAAYHQRSAVGAVVGGGRDSLVQRVTAGHNGAHRLAVRSLANHQDEKQKKE